MVATDRLVGDTTRVAGAASCVTVMVRVAAPLPERVNVPERVLALALAWQVTVIVAELDPVEGLTLSQLRDSLTVQEILELTARVELPPLLLKLSEEGETLRVAVGPVCVTVTY